MFQLYIQDKASKYASCNCGKHACIQCKHMMQLMQPSLRVKGVPADLEMCNRTKSNSVFHVGRLACPPVPSIWLMMDACALAVYTGSLVCSRSHICSQAPVSKEETCQKGERRKVAHWQRSGPAAVLGSFQLPVAFQTCCWHQRSHT